MFSFFNLVRYRFYVVVIFRLCMVQICGPGLGRHGPMKSRYALEPSWVTILLFGLNQYVSKKNLAFLAQPYLA
jgi:hypothetical protein